MMVRPDIFTDTLGAILKAEIRRGVTAPRFTDTELAIARAQGRALRDHPIVRAMAADPLAATVVTAADT